MPLKDYLFYQDDWATIYCGDNQEIMPLMDSGLVDLIVTDPPYGFNRFETDEKNYLGKICKGFSEWPRLLTPHGNAFVFTSTGEVVRVANLVPLVFRRILWLYKPNDCTYPLQGWLLTSEAILWFGDGKELVERHPFRHDCYVHTGVGQEGVEGHPTVKPLNVIQDLCSRGKIIFDPFLGSGTTCVAAKNLNRKSIGIEINPKYCEIAVKRLRQEVFDFRKP